MAVRSLAHGTTAIHVLVAACDTHSSAHSNSSSSPPATPRGSIDTPRTAATNVETKQRGVNASRDRMKQEMQHLRDSVEELQRQLDELKRDHNRRVPDVKLTRKNGADDPSAKQLAVAWEAMARGQCEQRYRAEVENVKLRKMLDEQVKVAQTLERILSKRRGADCLLDLGKPGSKRPRSAMCPIDRPSVFTDLELGLPSLYSQVDAVLRKENFLRHRDEPFRDIDVRHSDEIGSYVEATERRLLPFQHEDAAQAMWDHLAYYPEGKPRDDPSKDMTRNALRGDVDIAMLLARFTGHVHVKYVARRFVERDRVVIVWVAMVDPSAMAEPAVDGVVLRHTGWICARPAPLASPDPQAVMTEYLTAQLSVPEVYDEMVDRRRRVCTLTNFLVSSMTYQMDANRQNLDNLLLERAMSTSKVGFK